MSPKHQDHLQNIPCQHYDICIVGAGVAGSVLAAQLARFNYRILVVEKTFKKQKKISGELLQPGGVQCLKEMGLDFLLQGIDAQQVLGYTLYLQDEYFSIPYDRKKNFHAYSFKNSRFLEGARNYIHTLPQVDLVEGNVTSLIIENKSVKGLYYSNQRKKFRIEAALTFICEGAVSKLRQLLVQENKKKSGFFIGSFLTDCELPVSDHGHVILTGESPILIYPISSKESRILIDFPFAPKMDKTLQDYLSNVIRPQLPQTLFPAFDKMVAEGKFIGMPNQNLKSYPMKNKKNVVLVGDCFNMRHPLTGGGMSAIFHDIKNITNLVSQNSDLSRSSNVDRIISTYYAIRARDVANINILADSLYLATVDPHLKVASFNYLKQGAHGEDTIRILAGIDRKKWNLIKHFASVVTNGVNKLKINNRKKIRLLTKAGKIVIPLLLQEGNTQFHKWGNRIMDKFFSSSSLDEKVSTQKKTPH